MLTMTSDRAVMRKGTRVFAVLGRVVPSGPAPFGATEAGSMVLTAEFGSLRLERLGGDEENTGLEIALPTAFSKEYGIAGAPEAPSLTRGIFGLQSSELEQVVTVLRRGNYPMTGFSREQLKCSVSSSIIPPSWPHVVLSNQPLYGNVVSVEAFVRILVSSIPEGQLARRFPALLPEVKKMMSVVVNQRRGLPYHPEVLRSILVEDLQAK